MNLSNLSDNCLTQLWFKLQRRKYDYGVGYAHAIRCNAIQWKIEQEQNERVRRKYD